MISESGRLGPAPGGGTAGGPRFDRITLRLTCYRPDKWGHDLRRSPRDPV